MLEETNASGAAQADYIYLDGRPMAVLNGSTLYYLHDDMLGTPQVATDGNQAVQWQASYDSFGQASVSGTITQNLRLPGQYFDVESGWNHNGFRDYAPTLGRYVEPDPLGRLGSGNNLYVYVGNNPTNLVDPLGLCALNNCPQLPPHPEWAHPDRDIAALKGGWNSIQQIQTLNFYNMVRTGGPYDYKQWGPYADYGNFNYGYVGAALGIPDDVLLWAAGWANWKDNPNNRSQYGSPFDPTNPYHGDQPGDQVLIQEGIAAFKAGCQYQ